MRISPIALYIPVEGDELTSLSTYRGIVVDAKNLLKFVEHALFLFEQQIVHEEFFLRSDFWIKFLGQNSPIRRRCVQTSDEFRMSVDQEEDHAHHH